MNAVSEIAYAPSTASSNPADFISVAYDAAISVAYDAAISVAYNAAAHFTSAAYDASAKMMDFYAQTARACFLSPNLNMAVDEAKREEALGQTVFPRNNKGSFGIKATRINGKVTPVEIQFKSLFSTCDVWEFKCAEHATKPTMVIVAPYSGSRSTLMKYLAEEFVPDRNVVVIGWKNPHHVAKNKSFDMDDNVEAVMKACKYIVKQGHLNFDLMGTSHGGITAAIAAALMAEDPCYAGYLPENLILSGAPVHTRRSRTAMNWMAQFNHPLEEIIVTVGKKYRGSLRRIVPYGVMRALYKCTPDSLGEGYEHIALAAENVEQMRKRIFQDNLLARREYYYRGHKVNLGAFKGGLFVATAEGDAICPPAQTDAAHELFKGAARHGNIRLSKKDPELADYERIGHYDLVKPGCVLNKLVRSVLAFTERQLHFC